MLDVDIDLFVRRRRHIMLEGKSLSCSFLAAAGSPKAVCRVGDTDVTQWLLSQGWAELAEGVTDESYVEAADSARRRKSGIWAAVRRNLANGSAPSAGPRSSSASRLTAGVPALLAE
jgi:endonuclease YncB( thermonuclease family)